MLKEAHGLCAFVSETAKIEVGWEEYLELMLLWQRSSTFTSSESSVARDGLLRM